MIKGLADQHGILQEDRAVMGNIIQEYFHNLFTAEASETDLAVLSDVHRRVTPEMNTGLIAPFSYEEVKKALFQIGDLKGPGLDGLHAVFYKGF